MKTRTAHAPDLVPILLASDWIGLSPSQLLDLVADGKARGKRIKTSWHVCMADVDEWLKSNRK